MCGEYDDANVREHPCRHEVAVQERRSPEWYIQKKPSNLKDSEKSSRDMSGEKSFVPRTEDMIPMQGFAPA